MEGFAEVRTVNDFEAFTNNAGYPGLALDKAAYPGAHAAMDSLITQASGTVMDRYALIDQGSRGPVVMHFDLLAEGVVRNRLGDVVPDRAGDRRAVRAALIETMKHEHWPTLPDRSARTGEAVAEDIRRGLNAKVDEIRRHYQAHPAQPFPAESPNAEAARAAVPEIPTNTGQNRTAQPAAGADLVNLPPPAAAALSLTTMRFLSGQAPAAQATRHAPSLAYGSRGAGSPQVPGAGRSTPSRPGPADHNRD
jgi:hypothetical protein